MKRVYETVHRPRVVAYVDSHREANDLLLAVWFRQGEANLNVFEVLAGLRGESGDEPWLSVFGQLRLTRVNAYQFEHAVLHNAKWLSEILEGEVVWIEPASTAVTLDECVTRRDKELFVTRLAVARSTLRKPQ